jgi:hypothetical protein
MPDAPPRARTYGEGRDPSVELTPNLRHVLHESYCSVLAAFGPQLLATLDAHAHEYTDGLERHLRRHLEPPLHASAP